MKDSHLRAYLQKIISNKPADWLGLTTHRLDIYNEAQAKSEFLDAFEALFQNNTTDTKTLSQLPTAYDYIRLGHPLSSILEWAIAKQVGLPSENIISFGSQTMPILALLRTNLLADKKTRLLYTDPLPASFDPAILKTVYGYDFVVTHLDKDSDIPAFEGSTLLISSQKAATTAALSPMIDFQLLDYGDLGSVLVIGQDHSHYVADIQHVRRRETVAMTPADSLTALESFVSKTPLASRDNQATNHKAEVQQAIKKITNTSTNPIVGSSGLSVQYAIMMGLIDHAQQHHPEKAIKFVVPPNCYGGTNDQARRVAATSSNVMIVDLPVDQENDMVRSIDRVLSALAKEDAIPYIIAEIPTNPRVEVPHLDALQSVLTKPRTTAQGDIAIDPVFILDQTFCPNFHFLGEENILASVRAIAYASGSKFPSGGRCTAGYAVVNNKATSLMEFLKRHLELCDNEATAQQYQILAEQLPSMNSRIAAAYKNTRAFVSFIKETLPEAKINFVSETLAKQGFTPSVFSMDLPAKGATPAAREAYKRDLNLKLIHLMIEEIPEESKYCVSYGQLKGVYWTVPATSTQGTTKEGDKDYIVRASLSPDMDLNRHKEVFLSFVKQL